MDRLQMAGDMFAAARAFLESALEQQGLVRGTVAWRLAILDRMYGQEISPSCRRRLIERWSTERAESGSQR